MSLKNIFLVLGVASVLAGCLPGTMEQLRAKPGHQGSFPVSQSYENTYKVVLSNTRRCYEKGMLFASRLMVHGDLYPESKSGLISVSMQSPGVAQFFFGAEVKSIDAQTSEVTVFNHGENDGYFRIMRSWLESKSEACKLSDLTQ